MAAWSSAAVLLAGGSGSRVRGELNKVYLTIADRPVLEYSLRALCLSPRIGEVVLVTRPQDRARAERVVEEVEPTKPIELVEGGPTRHRSELAGLRALAPRTPEVVAIHDAARPFLTPSLLDRVIEAAAEGGGAVPVLEIEEPLYRVGDDGVALPLRGSLYRAQTPQAFRAAALLAAYEAAAAAGFEGVDTAETVERFADLEVRTVAGDPENVKLTYLDDFVAAEVYALRWAEEHPLGGYR